MLTCRARGDALLQQDFNRLIRSAAAARPRPSSGGARETLELELEPQTPLAPGMLLQRVGSRKDAIGDGDDEPYDA